MKLKSRCRCVVAPRADAVGQPAAQHWHAQSYKRFTKRMRETIFNPLFFGMSFAIGLSLGACAGAHVRVTSAPLTRVGGTTCHAGFALFDSSAKWLRESNWVDYVVHMKFLEH